MQKDTPVIAIVDNRLVKARFIKLKKTKVKVALDNTYRFVNINQVCLPSTPTNLNNYHGHLSFVFDTDTKNTAGQLYDKQQR